jgi:endonuclease/exonuclease/phosphatase family metal-dependent hydrolase
MSSGALRILVHNILEGFRPTSRRDDERRHLDRERVAAAQRLVADSAPDIYVMNEALYCRPFGDRLTDYTALLRFPHCAAALYDDEWGNAILSRHPIARTTEMRIYNRGGLRAEIETPEGRLTVASYHPHPRRRPENKAADFAELVDGVDGPVVVCGDFNCISPEDEVDAAALISAFSVFSATPEEDVRRFIKSGEEVFRVLRSRGLRDALPAAARRYTVPTDLLNPGKRSAMRIDHVLVSPDVEVIDGEVVDNEETNRISDHYPIRIDLRLAR